MQPVAAPVGLHKRWHVAEASPCRMKQASPLPQSSPVWEVLQNTSWVQASPATLLPMGTQPKAKLMLLCCKAVHFWSEGQPMLVSGSQAPVAGWVMAASHPGGDTALSLFGGGGWVEPSGNGPTPPTLAFAQSSPTRARVRTRACTRRVPEAAFLHGTSEGRSNIAYILSVILPGASSLSESSGDCTLKSESSP